VSVLKDADIQHFGGSMDICPDINFAQLFLWQLMFE